MTTSTIEVFLTSTACAVLAGNLALQRIVFAEEGSQGTIEEIGTVSPPEILGSERELFAPGIGSIQLQ